MRMERTASLSDVEEEEEDRRLRPEVGVAMGAEDEEEEEEHLRNPILERVEAEAVEVAKRKRCLKGCELTFKASIKAVQ